MIAGKKGEVSVNEWVQFSVSFGQRTKACARASISLFNFLFCLPITLNIILVLELLILFFFSP